MAGHTGKSWLDIQGNHGWTYREIMAGHTCGESPNYRIGYIIQMFISNSISMFIECLLNV